MTRGRFVAGWGVVLVLAACLWWGVHPPRTEDAYLRESSSVAERLASHVRTAAMWLDTYDAGQVTGAATTVALTEAESDAQRDASTYAAYQPPSREQITVRDRLDSLARQATTRLSDVRIDARDGRWSDATSTVDELRHLADQLLDLSREVRP
ncbi:MAG TPA: hypothetical protein VGD39_11665 [Nocardioides sp.]